MITERDGTLLLSLKVVPGAKQTKIVGPLGDALKVMVAAPPEAGAANAAVIELLANALGLSRRQIVLTTGLTSPRKTAQIAGISLTATKAGLGLK
jgi:uncharacterized protein (TIGR00251 family)